MIKKISILTACMFAGLIAGAQHKTFFEPTLPETKIANSLYNSIKVFDARTDTSNLGFVQTGAFNRKATVVTKKPLDNIANEMLLANIDNSADKGQLLLYLRQFSFSEITSAFGEKGFCAVQADMFALINNRYQKINAIDTLVTLTSGIDVTNKTLNTGAELLSNFITGSLLNTPVNPAVSFSYNDIIKMDSVEKAAIPLYNAGKYNDGLYLTYASFKNQTPDKPLTVTGNYVYPGNVKAPNEQGKLKDVKPGKAYAVVYNGQPYIVTTFGFYPLQKNNNDFYFTGRAKTSANTGSVIAAGVVFGALGSIMAAANNDATFEMRIDHKNGMPIKLKEVVEKPVAATTNYMDQ